MTKLTVLPESIQQLRYTGAIPSCTLNLGCSSFLVRLLTCAFAAFLRRLPGVLGWSSMGFPGGSLIRGSRASTEFAPSLAFYKRLTSAAFWPCMAQQHRSNHNRGPAQPESPKFAGLAKWLQASVPKKYAVQARLPMGKTLHCPYQQQRMECSHTCHGT